MSIHLPALVTLLTVVLLFGTALMVGAARGRHGIKAPATSGNPDFERVFRVQMNTLESSVAFLPALWVAAHYASAAWAGAIGLVWVAARVWYALAYSRDADKRGPAFGLAVLSLLTLVLLGFGGLAATVVG